MRLIHKLKTFGRIVLLALIIFSYNIFFSWVNSLITGESGYYGFVGGLVYTFIFGFWIYLLLCGLYAYISRNDKDRTTRYFKGFSIVLLGLIISVAASISEHQFLQKLDWSRLYIFFNIPLLVEIEFLLRKKPR